jgi:hypothetical protein
MIGRSSSNEKEAGRRILSAARLLSSSISRSIVPVGSALRGLIRQLLVAGEALLDGGRHDDRSQAEDDRAMADLSSSRDAIAGSMPGGRIAIKQKRRPGIHRVASLHAADG